jgi:hypothetical protein
MSLIIYEGIILFDVYKMHLEVTNLNTQKIEGKGKGGGLSYTKIVTINIWKIQPDPTAK